MHEHCAGAFSSKFCRGLGFIQGLGFGVWGFGRDLPLSFIQLEALRSICILSNPVRLPHQHRSLTLVCPPRWALTRPTSRAPIMAHSATWPPKCCGRDGRARHRMCEWEMTGAAILGQGDKRVHRCLKQIQSVQASSETDSAAPTKP